MSESENSISDRRTHNFPWGGSCLQEPIHSELQTEKCIQRSSSGAPGQDEASVISILASRILLHTLPCICYIVGSVIMFRFLIQLSWMQKTGWEETGAQRQSFVFEPFLASVSAFWFFLDFPMQSCPAVLPSARAFHDSCSQFQNTWEQDQLRPVVTVCQQTPDSRSLLVLDTSGTWEERTTAEKIPP